MKKMTTEHYIQGCEKILKFDRTVDMDKIHYRRANGLPIYEVRGDDSVTLDILPFYEEAKKFYDEQKFTNVSLWSIINGRKTCIMSKRTYNRLEAGAHVS